MSGQKRQFVHSESPTEKRRQDVLAPLQKRPLIVEAEVPEKRAQLDEPEESEEPEVPVDYGPAWTYGVVIDPPEEVFEPDADRFVNEDLQLCDPAVIAGYARRWIERKATLDGLFFLIYKHGTESVRCFYVSAATCEVVKQFIDRGRLPDSYHNIILLIDMIYNLVSAPFGELAKQNGFNMYRVPHWAEMLSEIYDRRLDLNNMLLETLGAAEESGFRFVDDIRKKIECIIANLEHGNDFFGKSNQEMIVSDRPEDKKLQMYLEIAQSFRKWGVIITEVPDRHTVKFAWPEYADEECLIPQFTYIDGLDIPGVFTMAQKRARIKPSQIQQSDFSQNPGYVISMFASRAGADVPSMPKSFLNEMRYISFLNGVLCCRTGIFYYRNERLEEAPRGYPYNVRDLVRKNDGALRAMQFIDQDCRYVECMEALLRGKYIRDHDPDYKAHWIVNEKQPDQQEGHYVTQDVRDEEDTRTDKERLIYTADPAAQEAWVAEKLKSIDTWINDPKFLEGLDPLDVCMRSISKIFRDQKIPRNAYRQILEMSGRSLCGVVGVATRKGFGHKDLERRTGFRIVDMQQVASVIRGRAKTGKSTLLTILQLYFQKDLVGHVSDDQRPIETYGTIMDKGVIMASDTHSDKGPLPQGDFKKIVSNEPVVCHILRQSSRIMTFVLHVWMAMNTELKYKDVDDDIARRIAHIVMKHRVDRDKGNKDFAEGDSRTLEEMFQENDLDIFPVIAVFAHVRRLINVGKYNWYDKKNPVFDVSDYFRETRSGYKREQNSFAEFFEFNVNNGNITTHERYKTWGVTRKDLLKKYKEYCDSWQCAITPTQEIDAMMAQKFDCALKGTPERYVGIKFFDMSIQLGNDVLDQEPRVPARPSEDDDDAKDDEVEDDGVDFDAF